MQMSGSGDGAVPVISYEHAKIVSELEAYDSRYFDTA